ncbi:MAG TPA: CARDB domain-containing protein [Longimicrobiaceae bacterium]
MKARLAILAALPLLAAAARPPLPDLVPAAVVGSGTTITVRVRNQGTAFAPAALLRVAIGAPINIAKNVPEPSIAAGNVRSVIIPVGKPLAGVHFAVRVDGTNTIVESNETNNSAAAIGH